MVAMYLYIPYLSVCMVNIPVEDNSKPVENLIVKIPTQLKRDYQKKCIDKGIKMRHEILTHIREFLSDNL